MKNKRNIITIIISAIFAVVLTCAFIFSVSPSYARDVVITNTDGTTVYITGDGVSWDETNKKYKITKDTKIDVHVVNEFRIFQSIVIDGNTYNTSFINDLEVSATGNDLSIQVNARSPKDEDKGNYFSNPFVIMDDGYIKSLEAIFAGRGLDSDYNKFRIEADDTNENVLAYLKTGYFVLNDNILLDANEFYGIGTEANQFSGCFDFKGYHVTMNILNQYNVSTPSTIYSGFFGYVNGNGTKSSILRDIDVNGKIAFDGNKGNTNYHYIGGVAGYVGANSTLTNIYSEMSVTTKTNSPMMIGGLFGRISTNLIDRYDYVYKANYGILQATTTGSEANISIGGLAGLIMDASVYSFEDKSVATHIVANNLGTGTHNSGTNAIGGVAGTVYSNTKDVELKNISMTINEDKEIVSSIDASADSEYSAAGGVYGVFDSQGDYKISTELVPIVINSGDFSVSSSTINAASEGTLYSGGFIGYFDSTGHELIYDYGPIPNVEDITLFDGNAKVASYQYGKGDAYAGGLFGYGALADNNDNTVEIIVNSGKDGSSLSVLAEQNQTTTVDGTTQYDTCSGFYSSKVENYALSDYKITVNNSSVKSQRSVGSTAVGNVFCGGFIGEARANQNAAYYFYNIDVNLNNSSVNAHSLSFDSVWGNTGGRTYGNNSAAGGFIGFVYRYGKAAATKSGNANFTWGTTIRGLENINVNISNNGVDAPEITVYCIQNATPAANSKDFFTEGYVGGVVGFYESSFSKNINAIASEERAIVYYSGTNTPNTASAGGLIGHTKLDASYNSTGLQGGKVDNLQVIGKAYSNKSDNNSPYDLYVGGAIGSACMSENTSSLGFFSDLHVFNTSVHAIGEEQMLAYAGGIAGGVYWGHYGYLKDCSFISGYVFGSSITSEASAGGIVGYSREGKFYGNVVLNSYVDAKSNDSVARAAGICSQIYSGGWNGYETNIEYCYSQSYVSSSGSNANNSHAAGIAIDIGSYNYSRISNCYFDLASFGNSYLSGNPSVPIITYNNRTHYSGTTNKYIVLYEDNSDRYSSLLLNNPATGNQISSANIYANANNRFYVKLEGDTTAATITNSNKTLSAKQNEDGLIVSSLWINIYGKTNTDSTVSSLKEEDGWYQFCSYAIKINDGRPVADTDRLSVNLKDDDTNNDIVFEYEKDSNGNPYRLDDDSNGNFETDDPYAVTNNTNVAGYYKYDDYTQYVLINMGQNGFYDGDLEHVAQSIKVEAVITNTGKPGYQNFPKYSFYELSSSTTQFGLDESLWTVPYTDGYTNYKSRVSGLLASANNKVYSSNFNGRLSVDRLLDEYALVITPNSDLSSRTIIMIEYENGSKSPFRVILEFVPNTIQGLLINPAEDTPALEVSKDSDVDADGKNDVVYTYVAGDTVRFEAQEDKRYNQLSFLANVKFKANSTYGIKTNGQVNVPNTSTVFPVECYLIADEDITGKVYIKVLSKVTLSFTTTGATYSSDRLAVQGTPFNFEFKSSPGFGLAPEKVTITTNKGSYELAGSSLIYSTTSSYHNVSINNCVVSFDHHTETYNVLVGKTIMDGITSLNITIVYPVVYSIVFDTGIPNVSIDERYIVYTLKEDTILDGDFYNQVYSEVFGAIKDSRYGFTLHDYYLTDEASSIPRYGDTFVTMTNPLVKKNDNGDVLYYYYLVKNSDNEDEEVKLFINSDNGKLYKDVNRNGTYEATTDNIEYYRYVTGPYTFYARWTYDIAIEVPDGITITSPLDPDKVVDLDPNDKIEGKSKLVPINTINGFSFNIVADSSFEGKARFMLFEVTKNEADEYVYKDLTNFVSLVEGSSSTYTIPQYDDMGNSLINGVIFLKVFSETIDFEVSDIGEYGSVSVRNDIYEDGIFTTTYGINYSKIKIGDTLYENGIPVSHTAGGNGVKFKFTDGSNNDLLLPAGTSLRVYRHINGTPYDAGELVLNSATNIVEINSFTNMFTGLNMSLANNMLVENELYNLVVTLPKGYTGFAHIKNAKITAVTTYSEGKNQYAYTLTYEYASDGNPVPVQPESHNVLMSSTRPDAFNEKAFDIFNIYSYIPASVLATRINAPTEATSGFTLQFTPSSGKQPNIFDHRHGSSYYLWEVEKTYSTDETGASVIRQYTAKDASGNDVSVVSETQHHYYYLATNGNLNLLNVPSGCKIRLLEVDSLANPAAGVVIYTYPAN